MKKAGIIGSGQVAKVLAAGFLDSGYDVMMGSRSPEKLQDVAGIQAGTFEETAAFSDLLVLAVKGSVAVDALKQCDLNGRTIIDATNPIGDVPPVDGVIQYFTTGGDSLIERLQKTYPDGNFVKAFNSVGNHLMYKPDFGGITPTMFICGNNEAAKAKVSEVLDQFGWETEDLGTAKAGNVIEALCVLWCIPGFRNQQWSHAFKLLRK